jgi:FKBP-type peptidyl-prolyl cis-trans isomerase 2
MEFEMTVKNGDFIKVDYTEKVDGQVIATTDKDVATENGIFEEEIQYGPRLIVVGSGQVINGFEEDLVGKEIGYSGSVTIPPEKAFGSHDPKKIEMIPATKFKENKPVPGMRISVDGKVGVITRLIGRKVSVDFNHPLVDKTITYEYKILEEIEDKQEKLKALIKTFAKLDLESKVEDDKAEVIVPWELSYYKEWLMIRRGLADMILQSLGLKEVDFVEKHTGAKVSAELISPPPKSGEEPEAEAETKPESQDTDSSPA